MSMRRIAVGVAVIASISLWAHQAAAQSQPTTTPGDSVRDVSTPDTLNAEIDSLRASKVAWREIAWKPCLLDGLKTAREQRKPVLLWIFIDRPADDARC